MPKTSEFQVHGRAAVKRARKPKPKAPEVKIRKVHPAVMLSAQMLADDRDVRIEVQRDGSVMIVNGRR